MSEFGVTPLRGRVIIKRGEAETSSPGGILYAPQKEEKSDQGVVMAVGEGVILQNGQRRIPVVEVGDNVLFTNFICKLRHRGDDYLVLSEDDILVVL